MPLPHPEDCPLCAKIILLFERGWMTRKVPMVRNEESGHLAWPNQQERGQ